MDPFYSTIRGAGFPKMDSMSQIKALGKNNYFHPILYAFSVALANRFNTMPECKTVLNKAANSIKAEQIYLEFTATGIAFKVKKFSDSTFIFAPGAFAYRSDNVRMKVKMVKT